MSEESSNNSASPLGNSPDVFGKMDRMYRYQRFFYDFTRKYYLLGRDRLLTEIRIADGDKILEIGCGTARNLIILAKKYPKAHFYGLDASAEMLKTAQAKIEKENIQNTYLAVALADDFDFQKTFGLNEKFEAIYFSYSLSMIPTWAAAIENALQNLRPSKILYIIDFYDQEDLPTWFRAALQSWLRQFSVKYPKKLIPYLTSLENQSRGKLVITPLYYRYSFIAVLQIFK